MGKLRQHLTYGNVVATIAVFLALGGAAYAATLAKNTVGSRQVKPNSLKGVDIRESSLGKVPKAAHADNAQTAASATNAGNAQTAANATNAGNAQTLDNLDSSAFGTGILIGHMTGLTTVTDTNDSGAASGLSNSTLGGSDTPIAMWTPNVPIVASDLAVRLTAAPGAGATRTFFIQAQAGPTSVSCPISGAALTCNSGAASAVLPAGSLVEFRESTNSTAPAPADALFGWRARPAP
jgi:hypothetical protein